MCVFDSLQAARQVQRRLIEKGVLRVDMVNCLAKGINGDQADTSAANAGAVYVLR